MVEHIIRNDGVRCSSHLSGTTAFLRVSPAFGQLHTLALDCASNHLASTTVRLGCFPAVYSVITPVPPNISHSPQDCAGRHILPRPMRAQHTSSGTTHAFGRLRLENGRWDRFKAPGLPANPSTCTRWRQIERRTVQVSAVSRGLVAAAAHVFLITRSPAP